MSLVFERAIETVFKAVCRTYKVALVTEDSDRRAWLVSDMSIARWL